MTYRLVIDIPGLPKTTNGAHGHWTTAAAERKKWRMAVRLSAYFRRPSTPLMKAKLICTRFSSSKPDRDNLAISFKSCVDGLVDARILVDDSDEIIVECSYLHEKVPNKQGKIRIEIIEIK